MYIDEVLERVLSTLNGVMIPASESAKIEAVRGGIQSVVNSVRIARAQEQAKKEEKKEEKQDEDHHE